ncbi:MAG: hypothetical protein RR571_04900, partial [Anaerorhabdus sp.]
DDIIQNDSFVKMKCTQCGYEEDMPGWCFDEVAEMMEFDGDTDLPHIVCPRCNHETLYKKDSLKFK